MTLKKFIQNLQDFVKENPECLDMDVVTSKDDKGNGYSLVHYDPSKGILDDEGDFITEEFEEYGYEEKDINAVCVN